MPFSKETLDFLVENRIQNDKNWFHEHKAQYTQYVLEPFVELVEQLTPSIWKIDPLLVTTPKVSKTISRIYRDTRYTKDKSLYRDVMWCVFRKDKKESESPCGLVLEISPDGFRYGCGYWQTPPAVMAALRDLILENSPVFQKAQEALIHQKRFQIEGDCYKRSRYPDQPEVLRQWLDRKSICLLHNSKDFELLFSSRLAPTVAKGFLTLKPVYELFRQAEINALHPIE